ERSDDELPSLQRGDAAPDLLDRAAVFVAHRRRLLRLVDPAIGPEIRSADAGSRQPKDRVRRLDDLRRVALLEADVACAVKDGSSHGGPHFPWLCPRYCSSVTFSSHSTALPSSDS